MNRTRYDDHYDRIAEYWRRFHAEKQALYKKQIIQGCIISFGLFSFPFIIIFIISLMSGKVYAADNFVSVDQIGTGNQITIVQDGFGHSASITAGSISPTDYNVFSIAQQGAPKSASIELKSGINNTFSIQQDGTGNHTAAIQNMIGSGNSVTVTQQGAGNHILNVTNPWNATNNGNTVTATQSGGAGADKRFDLMFSGATGAGVTINQTNPTQPDQAGMNIQCNPCGSGWSYTKF
jgi:hypothetical protein